MAQVILSGLLADRPSSTEIVSAGLISPGQAMAPEALAAVDGQGPDMSGHRSRTLTSHDVLRADLVLGMAREHVREVVVLVPEAWPHSYTLKELVRRGERHGSRLAGQSWPTGCPALARAVSASICLGPPPPTTLRTRSVGRPPASTTRLTSFGTCAEGSSLFSTFSGPSCLRGEKRVEGSAWSVSSPPSLGARSFPGRRPCASHQRLGHPARCPALPGALPSGTS